MVRQVVDAIETGDHLLVQAGTGTGKSLAYLIPLIAHALDSDKPSLVSTATLALQAQIVGRDLPRLLEDHQPAAGTAGQGGPGQGPRATTSAGTSSGAVSPRRSPPKASCSPWARTPAWPHFAAAVGGPSSQLGKEVVRLREWAEETATGDRDELMPGVTRPGLAAGLGHLDGVPRRAEMPARGGMLQRTGPAERGAEADVVVTNHAMLAISAFEGLAVLPEYDVVVVDEAHELQDRVTGAVSGQLSVRWCTPPRPAPASTPPSPWTR